MTSIALDCSGCKAEQTMKPTKVTRFSTVLRLIGWIIVVPSIFGVVVGFASGFATCFAMTQTADAVAATAQTDAESAGTTAAAGIMYGMSAFIAAASLVGGVVGYLLLLKRKVFRCVRCGFILDRA